MFELQSFPVEEIHTMHCFFVYTPENKILYRTVQKDKAIALALFCSAREAGEYSVEEWTELDNIGYTVARAIGGIQTAFGFPTF